jgi:hypothetical protein
MWLFLEVTTTVGMMCMHIAIADMKAVMAAAIMVAITTATGIKTTGMKL